MVFQVEISEIYAVECYSRADCGRKREKSFKVQEESKIRCRQELIYCEGGEDTGIDFPEKLWMPYP